MGRKKKSEEQPCWECARACGSCSWSADLTPVPGWVAVPHVWEDGDVSWRILSCPQLEKEPRRKPAPCPARGGAAR